MPIDPTINKFIKAHQVLFGIDYEVDFIYLIDGVRMAYATNRNDPDDMMEIEEQNGEINSYPVHDWDFNIDGYIFGQLEQGASIEYISTKIHCAIWKDICSYSEDYNYQKGMQMYLSYCKNNGITYQHLLKYDPFVSNASKLYLEEKQEKPKKRKEKVR